MKTYLPIILCIALCHAHAVLSQTIKTLGVKINVTDLDQAIDFYSTKIGFMVEKKTEDFVFLKTGDETVLVLHKVSNLLPETSRETRASFTLQVNDLDENIARLKAKGVDFGDEQKRKEGVGYAIYVTDPFGKKISLMHQTIVKVEKFDEPKIYNFGFTIPDMTKAIDFYTKILPFSERSQRYLPNDMPLNDKDNNFAFMLHFREGIEATRHNSSESEHVVILFRTNNLDEAIKSLKEKNVAFVQKKPQKTELGRSISFYDPFGYVSELVEVK